MAAFCAAAPPSAASEVLDWCGGKGHLGRSLAALRGLPLTVLERDPTLASAAQDLARRAGVELRFACGDALDPEARRHLRPETLAVALHACGGLSNALIAGLAQRPVAAVALAPCCFHLLHPGDSGFRPLSRRGGELPLDHATLRLATVEEVVASGRVRAARRREDALRLGLDLLLREAGSTAYTPLGTLGAEVLALPFDAFCHRVAAERSLRLPSRWSPAAALRAGEQRARQARALSLVRAAFRRPLELWLALDRALALAEQGYAVELGRFCARSVTPRNLLIRGVGA